MLIKAVNDSYFALILTDILVNITFSLIYTSKSVSACEQ